MAAAESHRLQQELSRGQGLAGPGGCSEPALPPFQRVVTILGEQFQLPLLPLARGRRAGASSASPLLILTLPGPCISQSRTTTDSREQSQGPVGHPRHGTPRGNAQGLVPALAGCSWALPVPWTVAASSSGTAQRGHQEPPPGTTHIPRPPWLISPAWLSRAKGFLHPPFPLPPAWFWGPNPISNLSCCAGEAPAQAVAAWLGCPQPSLVPGLASCGSHFPNLIAKDCPGASSAPLAHTAPIYSWQLPGLCRAGMTQAAPCAVGWMSNLCS